jgi:hypothetical protein
MTCDLQIASEVTLGPKFIFFLKILNFVRSFVKCKVSLADGTSDNSATDHPSTSQLSLQQRITSKWFSASASWRLLGNECGLLDLNIKARFCRIGIMHAIDFYEPSTIRQEFQTYIAFQCQTAPNSYRGLYGFILSFSSRYATAAETTLPAGSHVASACQNQERLLGIRSTPGHCSSFLLGV